MKIKEKFFQMIAAAAVISGLLIPVAKLSAQEQSVIILYGSEQCGYCKAMKRNLDAEKIAYTFYDINQDKTKGSEMWKKVYTAFPSRKGGVTFPVMDISGKILISPKFDEVKSLLVSGETKKESDDSSADMTGKWNNAIVIPDQDNETKSESFQDMKKNSVILQNRYYKSFVWDARRLPATPEALKNWRLLGFKNPYDSKTRSYIDWGKAEDRYLAFDIEEDEESRPFSLADDLFNSGKKFRVVLNMFESNGTKVKTISEWGKLLGLGSGGFMYVQEEVYGTMFTNGSYKENNSLSYKPDLGNTSKLSEVLKYNHRQNTKKP